MDSDIGRILAEHARLEQAATELELLVQSEEPIPEVFTRLSAFSNALAEHLLNEHHALETASRQPQPGAFDTLNDQLAFDLETLKADWDEYLTGWTDEDARADWDLFAEHTSVMIGRVRRRIQRENLVLCTAAST